MTEQPGGSVDVWCDVQPGSWGREGGDGVWQGSSGRRSAACCPPQALPSVEGTSADRLFQLMRRAEGIPSAACRVLRTPYSDQTLTQSFDI